MPAHEEARDGAEGRGPDATAAAGSLIPTEGPCAGHRCDRCYLCTHGHCCRRDCPTYERPKLGDWTGTVSGDLGILAVSADETQVQCHCCGAWKTRLGGHILWEHDLFADEYRALFGLRQRTGLAAPAYKDRVRTRNAARLARIRPEQSYFTTLTPEQHAAFKEQTQFPLETLLDPKYRAARARAGALTSAKARIYPCACGCGGLLPPGNGPHRGQRYLQGHAPPSLPERIARLLAQAPGPLSCAEILAVAGGEDSQVRRALSKIVARGLARRTGRGLYTATATVTGADAPGGAGSCTQA